jgi:hypothetical protein
MTALKVWLEIAPHGGAVAIRFQGQAADARCVELIRQRLVLERVELRPGCGQLGFRILDGEVEVACPLQGRLDRLQGLVVGHD